MQIGTCLNTSFLFPSSNSGGGVNENRKGPAIRSEREKRVRRKPVNCLVELKPDLPFNNPPIFLKEMLLPTWLTERPSFFLGLSVLSEPVFTFRNILITIIICNLLFAMGALPHLSPNPQPISETEVEYPLLTSRASPSSPHPSSNTVPEALLHVTQYYVG